ncbi:hypothetical protein XA68_15510 [Ophiocordyceps unilateralis]|uniref:U1-C C2H2-type zinc finger domain-containing protein n=1 Tax=Ophiocordyceps unilateralis TaxID=268505 RepID=A0A2A9P878_OPHUN|nr:hypothetical protein XA68_15510 [Ophiocordyceps unilateralis]
MSEYWKSTPRYWCKHCSCYVRDTKLERQNHEATGRHQGAIQRSLRNMHREHEREEREKDQARQEIARLNGLVSGRGGAAPGTTASQARPREATEAERQQQREQLAELGVAMPETLRSDMAMAGEWTVTSTRVIGGEEDDGEAKATGVRKREATSEGQGNADDVGDENEEEAVRRLFKKQRKWGKDSKLAQGDDEARELDALLSGTVIALKTRRGSDNARDRDRDEPQQHIKIDEKAVVGIKREVGTELEAGPVVSGRAEPDPVKEEPDTTAEGLVGAEKTVVFKKRKPKGIRIK